MFCNNCGTKNPDGAKYCSACGVKMNFPETTVSGSDSDSLGRCDKSYSDKENFRKKLRSSIEKDAEGVLDFVVIQVPYGDFVQFFPMEEGGFYVEFAVGESLSSWMNNPHKYSRFDKLYQQYGYKYSTENPEDDLYVKEYPAGSEEDMIREIPDLIVAIKGNCLSVCLYEDSLKGPDDNDPIPPVKKKFRLFSFENDGCFMVLFKLLLIGLISGVSFGGIMFILSEYVW